MADPTQLHQVVMNLATNAAHAMENGDGVLTISLDEAAGGPRSNSASSPSAARRCVRLTVADTGQGIEPAIRERIFDPYFTTKSKGKGTGMGLSVVHGIVQNYGGDIEVESAPGEGSAFRVYLPVKPPEDPPEGLTIPTSIAQGHERILVVDDEPQITRVMTLMLESLGYRVSAFSSSRDALRAFQENRAGFDLIVTDMTMPGLTGEALARAVFKLRPDMPIILCTGFNEQINEERAQAIGIHRLVYKPVMRATLAEVVRSVLDR
jgi:CheY-like chemotaxis protein